MLDVSFDQAARLALKSYSNWPNFPQIYVNGDFLGGFETVLDLYEHDELLPSLTGAYLSGGSFLSDF